MGKNNRKPLRRKIDEKEFIEMRNRIMNDAEMGKKEVNMSERSEHFPNNISTRNRYNSEEKIEPVSRTNDFIEVMKELINEISIDGVTVEFIENRKKEVSGIVFVDVTIKSTENENKYNRLLFYYIEEHGLKQVHAFPAVITIINQKNGNVLFNKFGTYCIDKAKSYIIDILRKNASGVLK